MRERKQTCEHLKCLRIIMPQNNPDRQLYVHLGLTTYMELSMLFEYEIPNHQMNLG